MRTPPVKITSTGEMEGRARIRTQVSAAHTKEDLEFAVRCFIEARRQMEEDAKA